MRVEVDEAIRAKVHEMADEVNKYVNSGKWELFNDDAKELTRKYPLNELLLLGVKYIKLPNNKFYLELPYRGLDDGDIENALYIFLKTTKKLS